MSRQETFQRLCKIIEEVARDYGTAIAAIKEQDKIVDDLGFTSLEVAVLTTKLEMEFQCEPFTNGDAPITDIKTVGQVCRVYDNVINNRSPLEGVFDDTKPARVSKRAVHRRGKLT